MRPEIETAEIPSWSIIRDQLVRFVDKRVESSEAAEDIVQDVLVRLQRAEPGSITNPKAWLYRAARNATIDHYRTRRADESLDHQTESPELTDAEGPNSATRELAACLRPLVQQLPAKYREAVTLVDLEGSTHAVAAEAQQISVSGMKSRVQRGRARLGELLTDCCAVVTDGTGAITDYQPTATSCHCGAGVSDVAQPGQPAE